MINNKTINILLLGKTRSGKTTVAEVFKDPLYVPPKLSLFEPTRNFAKKNFPLTTQIL